MAAPLSPMAPAISPFDSGDVINVAADTQLQQLSSGTDGYGNALTDYLVLEHQGSNWVQTSTLHVIAGAGG